MNGVITFSQGSVVTVTAVGGLITILCLFFSCKFCVWPFFGFTF